MGFENAGFGANDVRPVRDEKPRLNPETYTKLSVAEALSGSFTAEEEREYTSIMEARSLGDLRAALDRFNGVSTPKKASDLGLSLADMLLVDEPISVGEVHDLPDDAQVVVSRTMDGVTSFRIADKKPLS